LLRLSGAKSASGGKLAGGSGLGLLQGRGVLHGGKAGRAAFRLSAKGGSEAALLFANGASGANVTKSLLLTTGKPA
jgi:hypothetical protein